MGNKNSAICAGRILKSKKCGEDSIQKHQAFEARFDRWLKQSLRQHFAPSGDDNLMTVHGSAQTCAGWLVNLRYWTQCKSPLLCQLQNSRRQRML